MGSVAAPDFLAAAYDYVFTRGWSVIPIRPGDKKPAVPSWKEFQHRLPTADELDSWFGDGSDHNIGIVCGKISGNLVVLDADGPEGERTLAELKLPRTVRAKTGRGTHVYLHGDAFGTGVRVLPGVDVRGEGGYVVAPPSVHETGHVYAWVAGHAPDDVDVAPLAKRLRATAAKAGAKSKAPEATATRDRIAQGARNATLAALAGTMRRAGLEEHSIRAGLLAVNHELCDPPLSADEVGTVARSIGSYEPKERPKDEKTVRPRGTEDERTSWSFIDLGPILDGDVDADPPPMMALRTDGPGLFYAGRCHALNGEPDAGKSWLALFTCTEQIVERIAAGEHVIYIDHDDSARGVVSRLRAFGVERDVIIERFHYVRPEEPLSPAARADLERAIAELPSPPTLIVIDGMNKAMTFLGLDPNSTTDVATWHQRIVGPLIAATGATVVVIDHVTKSKDSRGRYAIGSQQKLAGIDGAAYTVENVKPFGRGLHGISRIIVARDRPGYVRGMAGPGDVVGEFHLISNDDGSAVTAELRPAQSGTAGETAVPPSQRSILRVLNGEAHPLTRKDAIDRIVGWGVWSKGITDRTFRAATKALLERGEIDGVEEGGKASVWWRTGVPPDFVATDGGDEQTPVPR